MQRGTADERLSFRVPKSRDTLTPCLLTVQSAVRMIHEKHKGAAVIEEGKPNQCWRTDVLRQTHAQMQYPAFVKESSVYGMYLEGTLSFVVHACPPTLCSQANQPNSFDRVANQHLLILNGRRPVTRNGRCSRDSVGKPAGKLIDLLKR